MTDFESLFRALCRERVEFIIVGGVAATLHGASRLTQDLDIVYGRSEGNLERLVAALTPLDPYLRGAPPGLPFRLDAATLKAGLNFTLETSAGSLDLLGEITGGGGFNELVNRTIEVELFGHRVLCLERRALIDTKRAAGRPKDFEVIAELESLGDDV